MADLTWDDVIDFAPELTTTPDGAQDVLLGYVNETLNATNLGGVDSKRFRMAQLLFVAHCATIQKARGTSVGPIVSETASKLSRSYANANPTNSALGASPYGAQLSGLFHNSPGRVGRAV